MKTGVVLAVWLGMAGCDGQNEFYDSPPHLVAPRLALSTPEDTGLAIDVTAEDRAGEPLTYTPTAPRHGVLTGIGPIFHYAPAQDYAGDDDLTIVIGDANHPLAIAVQITVTPVDDAPIADDVAVETDENTAVPIALHATDVDSASFMYRVLTGPAHGALTGVAPSFTYTPARNYAGADAFTYEVSDGHALSNHATVAIAVADGER